MSSLHKYDKITKIVWLVNDLVNIWKHQIYYIQYILYTNNIHCADVFLRLSSFFQMSIVLN